MSRPTISPAVSPEEIAAQIAAFKKSGGKIQKIPEGKCKLQPMTMEEVHDKSWLERLEKAREKTKFKPGNTFARKAR